MAPIYITTIQQVRWAWCLPVAWPYFGPVVATNTDLVDHGNRLWQCLDQGMDGHAYKAIGFGGIIRSFYLTCPAQFCTMVMIQAHGFRRLPPHAGDFTAPSCHSGSASKVRGIKPSAMLMAPSMSSLLNWNRPWIAAVEVCLLGTWGS